MLKINRILSKKIKSPLSLRGKQASPCESRGSNLSGFSLIELMVAAVILAIALLGIFQAYSVGFMGMADARDRTVATNYLREMIEDFKNMDFNQVKSESITPIHDTKFSRGAYVLNLEEIYEVVTLKKVITQVRWMDRKGNIKTVKASTILYNKPTTSEVSDAARIIIYAQPYYTILPTYEGGLDIFAEIKDEYGNTVYSGDITFTIITTYDPDDVNDIPVGYIYSPGRTKDDPLDTGIEPAPDGTAHVKFYPFTLEFVDGIERIQASAIIDGVVETDTVNIRVTTGPVGILLEPATEEDRILAAGGTANINLTVVKADYSAPIAYEKPITLSAVGPGTLSTTTISAVPTDGTPFDLTSTGTPGVVEITASAPDLDMGYIEITFTGEPASILITPEKDSIYPGEDINITVTIVDVNNVQVGYNGNVNLTALPPYGSFNDDPLSFTGQSSLDTTVFTANSDAPAGETITIQASSGVLSGSTEITILSLLTPKYLKLFADPFGVDLDEGESSKTVTAQVYDESGDEIVTTYNTPITFFAKIGEDNFGEFFPSNSEIPIDGEVEVELYSTIAGTTIVTASSGDLILTPEEGVEVVFYESADHIKLSADPSSIEVGGNETSIITATMCDAGGNEVVNYNNDPGNPKFITFTSTVGKFHTLGGSPSENDESTIIEYDFDGGVAEVEFYSDIISETPAEISAVSSDDKYDNGLAYIEITGDIPSVLTLGEVTNQTDYLISFDITVTGSPIYLEEIKVEWNNSSAPLDDIIIDSPYPEEDPLNIPTYGADSPCTESDIDKTLVTTGVSNIGLNFRDGVSKMKQKDIIVTFTDDDTSYVVSFRVPNM